MAAATSISPTLASASSTTTTSIICKKRFSSTHSFISLPQHTKFQLPKWNSQLGSCKFSTWNGLRHLGVPTSHCTVKFGRQGRSRGKGVHASLFGVGAPEALVIGVVALLVFGPRGLAEVARNLGKTLRAFQPTIRELQEVSREFKSTLEREISLDEIPNTTKPVPTPLSTPAPEVSQKAINPEGDSLSSSKAYTTEEYLKIFQEQLKKPKEMTSSESEIEAQQSQDSSPPSSSGPSLAEEYAWNSQEQLEAPAALQQKETASSESQDETQDSFPAVSDAETQEYLKKLEEEVEAVIAKKQKKAAAGKVASATAEVKSQDAQEAASVTSLSQYPENET